jgi:hypothetical protein
VGVERGAQLLQTARCVETRPLEPDHELGGRAHRRIARAELTTAVFTPAIHHSARDDRASVRAASGDVTFSNSMVESWWRSLKHGWLYINHLDSMATLRKLIEFYVAEHNQTIPHSAFDGQTPDEMYLGRGEAVPDALVRRRRLAWNRTDTLPAPAASDVAQPIKKISPHEQ